MLNRIIMLVIFLVISMPISAGELYLCRDEDGEVFITDELQPGMKCRLKEIYRDLTPEEIAHQRLMDRITALEERAASRSSAGREPRSKVVDPACTRECKLDRDSCNFDHSLRSRSGTSRLCEESYGSCMNRCYR